MNYFLSKDYKDTSSAGNKAKTDIERILEKTGMRSAGLPRSFHSNKVVSFVLTLAGVLKSPFTLRKGDVLVLQYPLKKYYAFVCNLAHLRGAKVVTIVHDLGSFRRKKLTVSQEIARLSHTDYLVVHNESMKAWLTEQGFTKPMMGVLGIFDYLADAPVPEGIPTSAPITREGISVNARPDLEKTQASASLSAPEASSAVAVTAETKKTYTILYAGGLRPRKNAFLYEIGAHIRNYHLNLYGSGFEPEQAKGKEHFTYMGFVPSDTLIATAKGDFGLVWDGESVDECTGDFGEYLKYNNPHKASLYLRCGLPVIIWSQAALAPFVRQHKLGFCVDSLAELDEVLAGMDEETYCTLRRNAAALGRQLNEGHFVRRVVEQAIATLK